MEDGQNDNQQEASLLSPISMARRIIAILYSIVFYDQPTALIDKIKHLQDVAWLLYLLLNLGFMLSDKTGRRSLPDRAVNTRIVKTINAPIAMRR